MNTTTKTIITNIKQLIDRNISPFQYLKSIDKAQSIGVISEFEVNQVKQAIQNYKVKL